MFKSGITYMIQGERISKGIYCCSCYKNNRREQNGSFQAQNSTHTSRFVQTEFPSRTEESTTQTTFDL